MRRTIAATLTGLIALLASLTPAPAAKQPFSAQLAKRFPQLTKQPLAWAHPNPDPVTVRQPDGTRIALRGTDMEVGGYSETMAGHSVVQDANGWYVYALNRNGNVVPSKLRVGIDAPKGIPTHAAKTPSAWIDVNGKDPRGQIYEAIRTHQAELQAAAEAAGTARVFKIPALMFETHGAFQPENDAEHFTKLLSGTRDTEKDINPRGTLTELYLEMSWGTFEPRVDVYGPYTSVLGAVDRCYYGWKGTGDLSNLEPSAPSPANTVIGMALEAVPQADPDVNFADYDNDEDGDVDFLLIIHSGTGREATLDDCDVHSHYSSLTTMVTADGVTISGGMTIPEINLQIGVAAHEFMHALGEPDYYDTDNTGEGTGEWDLGGGGPWLGYPPQSNSMHFNPFMKVNLAWTQPRVVTATTKGLKLRPRELFRDIVVVPVKTQPCTDTSIQLWCHGGVEILEGFVLEMNSRSANGQPRDLRLPGGALFDRFSHANGLMVWHFDTQIDANNDETHPRLDLEEADWRDGVQDVAIGLTRGDPRDLFYDDATGLSTATVRKVVSAPGADGKPMAVPAGSPWTVVSPPTPCADPETDCPSLPGAVPPIEFEVTDDPDNAVLRAKLNWTSLSADDWDLYVDHMVDGAWVQLAYSASSTDPAVGPVEKGESLAILRPEPGRYRIRAINWLAPTAPTAEASVELQSAFAKGDNANTLAFDETPTNWAFTNIRPDGDGIRLDLVKHTVKSFDLSADIVTADSPLAVGSPATLETRVYNHGGKAVGPVVVTVTNGGAEIARKSLAKLDPYGSATVSFEYTPVTRGLQALQTEVAALAGESVSGNNVQRSTVYVGDAGARVLIVDDDQGYGLEEAYAGTLAALGVPFTIVEDHAALADMKRHDAVIWVGGSTQRKNSVDSTDRAALAQYLTGGGKVLLTGSRMVYGIDIVEAADTAPEDKFLSKYFGAGYLGSWQFGRGDAEGSGLSFLLELAPGRPLVDELTVAPTTVDCPVPGTCPPLGATAEHPLGGKPIYTLDPEGDEAKGTVGVRFDGSKFRSELNSFSLAQVVDAETRVSILKGTLEWLGVKLGGRTVDTSPQILHAPWRLRLNGQAVPIVASVTDDAGIAAVNLTYRVAGAKEATTVPMVRSKVKDLYEAMIPASAMTPKGLEYRISAVDTEGNLRLDPSVAQAAAHVVTSAIGPKAAPMASIVSPGPRLPGIKPGSGPLPATGVPSAGWVGFLPIAAAAASAVWLRRKRTA